jgi:hypothetical protein
MMHLPGCDSLQKNHTPFPLPGSRQQSQAKQPVIDLPTASRHTD